MKTTATARKTASTPRGRAAPPSLKSKAAGTARGKTTSGAAKKPYVIKKPKWTPAPRPSMHMICYDFCVKLVRGLCLGIGLGLVVSLAIPWTMDTSEWLIDKYYDADLAIDWTALQDSLQNKTSEQVKAWKRPSSKTRPPLREVEDVRVKELRQFKETFQRFPRAITLVHAGHTGGRSLLYISPTIACKERFSRDPSQIPSCIQQQQQSVLSANTNITSSPLAQQLQNYVHLGSVNTQELQNSTSFLYTIRNPVDRVLATFTDAHPLSCPKDASGQNQQHRPWGCETANYWNMPGTFQHNFYSRCFPDLSPEPFAQAVASPWPPDDDINANGAQQLRNCRWMARSVVMGGISGSQNDNMIPIAPHMHYNYDYYAKESLFKFSRQEILVVRSNKEQEDVALLSELLANGDVSYTIPKVIQSTTVAPIVTPQAYQKLCCVLEKEIEIYEAILMKATNLPQYAKEESMHDLRRKCGLAGERDWQEWSIECKQTLELDLMLLSPPHP